MKKLISTIFVIITILLYSSLHAEEFDMPQVDAINLVVRTQYGEIRNMDKGDWWHDTKLREWSVRRPFGPGYVDSTHIFIVTYKIDGKSVMTWSVDTQKNTVFQMENTE